MHYRLPRAQPRITRHIGIQLNARISHIFATYHNRNQRRVSLADRRWAIQNIEYWNVFNHAWVLYKVAQVAGLTTNVRFLLRHTALLFLIESTERDQRPVVVDFRSAVEEAVMEAIHNVCKAIKEFDAIGAQIALILPHLDIDDVWYGFRYDVPGVGEE